MQKSFVRDLLERVVSTFAQVYLAFVVAAPGQRVQWRDAVFVALFAAVATVLTTVLVRYGALRPFTDAYADLAYRVGVTFLQTLAGLVVAAGVISALDFDWSGAVKTSLLAAGAALLKGLVGLRSPDTVGASVLVATEAAPVITTLRPSPTPAALDHGTNGVETTPSDTLANDLEPLDDEPFPTPPNGEQPGSEPDADEPLPGADELQASAPLATSGANAAAL